MSRIGRLVRTVVRQKGRRDGRPEDLRETPAAPSAGPGGVHYAPELDGEPDPGEVVWAWVPYEDDPQQGKDRPVLVIGRDGATLLALQLTSQDHDLDAADEARYGRYWMDIGPGAWDRQGRPSEVRLDRLLRLDESAVRREGALVPRELFDAVLREARRHHDF